MPSILLFLTALCYFLSLFASTCSRSLSERWPDFHKVPGDVFLGVIHPMGYNNLTHCTTGSYTLTMLSLAYIWAVQQVNSNLTLLPNHTLGLYIGDSCTSKRRGLAIAQRFVGTKTENCPKQVKVAGVLGCFNSGCTTEASYHLQTKELPLLSPTATASVLEDNRRHPYLLRMVPSNRQWAHALAEHLKARNLSLLALIYSTDEYGQNLYREFQHERKTWQPCIPFVRDLPPNPGLGQLKRIVRQLQTADSPRANVVLVLTRYREGRLLARYYNQSRPLTFLFPDSIVSTKGIGTVNNNSVILTYRSHSVDRFRRFLLNQTFENIKDMPWTRRLRQKLLKNSSASSEIDRMKWSDLLSKGHISKSREKAFFDRRQSLVIDAVFYFARCLTDAMKRCSKNCLEGRRIFPILKKYVAGRSKTSNYELLWPGKDENVSQNPLMSLYSNCTPMCNGPRQFLEQNVGDCCPTCRHCHPNQVVNSHRNACEVCPSYHWPSSQPGVCYPLPKIYLRPDFAPASIMLFLTVNLGLILVATVVIFVVFRDHRIVKSSAFELMLVKAFGLVLVLFSVPLYTSLPTSTTCAVRFGLLNGGIALAYAALLIKTIRIWRIFNESRRSAAQIKFIDNRTQLMMIALMWTPLVLMLSVTMGASPPVRRHNIQIESIPKNISAHGAVPRHFVELFCYQNDVNTILPYTYNILLMALCLAFAFRTRKLPDNFNESRFIFFCVFTSILVDILFIPSYYLPKLKMYKNLSIVILSIFNVTMFIFSLFIPRIYSLYQQRQQSASVPEVQMNSRPESTLLT